MNESKEGVCLKDVCKLNKGDLVVCKNKDNESEFWIYKGGNTHAFNYYNKYSKVTSTFDNYIYVLLETDAVGCLCGGFGNSGDGMHREWKNIKNMTNEEIEKLPEESYVGIREEYWIWE